jgi:hypothetical protein
MHLRKAVVRLGRRLQGYPVFHKVRCGATNESRFGREVTQASKFSPGVFFRTENQLIAQRADADHQAGALVLALMKGEWPCPN